MRLQLAKARSARAPSAQIVGIMGVGLNIVPTLTIFVLMITALLPMRLASHIHLTPMFTLMGIYFWAVFRPHLIPLWAVFLFGIIMDLLSGDPLLGISAFLFTGLYWLVVSQHRFFLGQNFSVLWAGFAILAGLSAILQFLMTYLFLSDAPHFMPFLLSAGISAILYPAIAGLLHLCLRLWPKT